MAAEPQFCLRWNNFSSAVTNAIHKLHEIEEFVDVTIVVEDVQMKAHKVVLSACSPYFRNILKSNPCQHPVIILREATVEDLESVLTFMYEGEVNIAQLRLHTFLHLARTLQVQGLTVSNNESETQDNITNKGSESKWMSSLDLTTRKRRHSSTGKANSQKSSCDPVINSSVRRLSQDSAAKMDSLPQLLELPSVVGYPTKRKKYSDINTMTCSNYNDGCYVIGKNDDNEQEDVASLQNLHEVKMEQTDSNDCHEEGKENGDIVPAERGYHLRRSKPKNLSTRDLSQLQKGAEEFLLAPVENNRAILTVPQRASLCDKPDQDFIPKVASAEKQSTNFQPEFPQDPACQNLPFPCPFCEKSYTSWGFRRRHIKGYHAGSPQLPCKWCFAVLPSHGEWESHVIRRHDLSLTDAHNGLLILEEAHMVLQIAQPTRIDSLMELIKNKKGKEKDKESESKERGNKEKNKEIDKELKRDKAGSHQ